MARNSKVSLVLVGVVIMIIVLAGVANAKGATPWMFETKEGCWAAVNAGEGAYKIYVPKDLRGSKKDPVDGITKVVAPLETVNGVVACVEMDTQTGRKFVPQAEGTKLRWRVNADGPPTPYALDSCGNKVYSISYPTPKKPEAEKKAEAEAPPAPVGPQVGDLCTSIDETSGKVFSGQVNVDAYGGAYCGGEDEVEVPGIGTAIAQYTICPLAGGFVGYSRSGVPGALSGAVAGAGGTYVGRAIGGENWGWAGCVTGPAVGLIKWGKGGSPRGGSPINPPLSGSPFNPPLY